MLPAHVGDTQPGATRMDMGQRHRVAGAILFPAWLFPPVWRSVFRRSALPLGLVEHGRRKASSCVTLCTRTDPRWLLVGVGDNGVAGAGGGGTQVMLRWCLGGTQVMVALR